MALSRMTAALGPAQAAVDATLADWRGNGKVDKLWAGDAALWSGTDEAKWLGWLTIVENQKAHVAELEGIAEDIKKSGFEDALLMGMGGSSLCPEVLELTFGRAAGFPKMHVLDSTVPAQVRAFRAAIDPTSTVCIVSSKSGGTTEPNVFRQYFQAELQKALGDTPAGSRFIAVTDPGTKMERVARENGFRHIGYGDPTIGGRFSALSHFGMVPAAVMGLDVGAFLASAGEMVAACGPGTDPRDNPGVHLGVILGTLAAEFNRDKVTIVASPGIGDLGAWLEQLIAESTGKTGLGLVPVDSEHLGAPAVYGADRVFAYIRLDSEPSAEQDAVIEALGRTGHPVIEIHLADKREIAQQFYCWEIATAVVGSILGINAFNQPDVEASKIKTRELSEEYAKTGVAPAETPIAEGHGLKLFTDPRNAEALGAPGGDVATILKAHLDRIRIGDYFALTGYVQMDAANGALLQSIRHAVRDTKKVATTLGYGPRFLHSTGQLHKGGPNTGVFIQITSDDAEDLAIPGETYTFGLLKQFQAMGDFAVLAERDRRALRVHLGADVPAGLKTLHGLIAAALD